MDQGLPQTTTLFLFYLGVREWGITVPRIRGNLGRYSGPRPRLWRSTSYSHRKATAAALLLALAPAPSGGHGALGENSAVFIMPGSESFYAASGGRCRSLKDPSPNTYRRRGQRWEGPGYASLGRRAQIETGHAVYSMVSSPLASQKPSAGLGSPGG